MSQENDPNKENLFNTPNPTELKKAAKEDPIAQRESSHEANTVRPSSTSEEPAQLGAEVGVETSQSPIVEANLSGY